MSRQVASELFAEQLFAHSFSRTVKERAIRNLVSFVINKYKKWDKEDSYPYFDQDPFDRYTALHCNSTDNDIQFQLATSFAFDWERQGCKTEQDLKTYYTTRFGVDWHDDVATTQAGKNESRGSTEMAQKADH